MRHLVCFNFLPKRRISCPKGPRSHGFCGRTVAQAALNYVARSCLKSEVQQLFIPSRHIARIIHQPEKSTREDPFGGQMVLNTTVLQDHYDPTTSSADGLYMASIDLIGAIRRTASRQPPRADNHRFAREPPEVSIALTGPEARDVHP